jgi:hypothetical protein
MKTLRNKMREKKLKNKRRRNKTQKKHKKGGKIDHLSLSTRISNVMVEIPYSEILFAMNKLYDSLEYCGKYVIDYISTEDDSAEDESIDDVTIIESGGTCILKSHDDNPGRIDRSGRANCVIGEKELYAIIWHTHPYESKFYPSREDILMVKKTRKGEKIKLSVIYTSIGIWLLKSFGDNLDPTEIDRINDKFYNTCYRGRKTHHRFKLYKVLRYIEETYIPEMRTYCEMDISFVQYTEYQTINIDLTDVRLDALNA